MKKYKAVLFDFDGTLVNTNRFVEDYTKQFINYHKLKADDYKTFFMEINTGNSRLGKDLQEKYWRGFKRRQPKEIQFFDGVRETINKLKQEGYKLGVVTTSTKARLEETPFCCIILVCLAY